MTNSNDCTKDNGWTNVSNQITKEYSSSGTYYIRVKDNAGNVQSKNYSVPAMIGDIQLSSGSGSRHTSNFTITASSANATKIEFIKNNSVIKTCSSSSCNYDVTNETSGETIIVKSTGELGQEKSSNYVVKLDKNNPIITETELVRQVMEFKNLLK